MNKLSYGLLSFLTIEPMTGYDLTSRINAYWKSTHSAIYPLLSELEEKGYVFWELLVQHGKPDKKIYNLTQLGYEELEKWLVDKASDPVNRDEIILKLFCIKRMNEEIAFKVFDEFENKCLKRIKKFEDYISNYRNKFPEGEKGDVASVFGSYIVVQRSLNHALMDLEWCKWVRELYSNEKLDFLMKDFKMIGD